MENDSAQYEHVQERPTQDKPGEEPDNACEEKRARVYGLELKDLLDQSIITGPDKYVRLSGVGKKSDERGLVRLQPRNTTM